jgi:hypothetical protein
MSGILARLTDRFRRMPERVDFLKAMVCDSDMELTLDRLRRLDLEGFSHYFGTGAWCKEFVQKLSRRKIDERHAVYTALFDRVRNRMDWMDERRAKAYHIFCFDAFTIGSEDEFVISWLAGGHAFRAFPPKYVLDATMLWLRNAKPESDSFRISQIFRGLKDQNQIDQEDETLLRVVLGKLRDRTASHAVRVV